MSFSVLLSVYAKEQPDYFKQAFLSIWDQQTLKPDQIVLVKDGPLTAELDAEIQCWQEKLGKFLTVVELPENVGLGAALNEGLKACKHELVARMDTDDISLPDRFEKQDAFMQAYHDVAASSAFLEEFDPTLIVSQGSRQLPLTHDEIVSFGKRRSPLNHPLAIFKKSVVQGVGGYPPLRNAQDYGLWSLLIVKGYLLANLPETLAHVRAGEGLIERRGLSFLRREIQLLLFQKRIGYLNSFDFSFNFLARSAVRLSPVFIKRFAYRLVRNRK